ncbi:MAG: tRNA pseudouridine(38-40) synthase TruA [Brevinematia bacterium]
MVSFEFTSLRNIKMKIAYNGGFFKGWQRHFSGDGSVEDVLSNAIEGIVGEKIVLVAASRTDKGVHACGQIVNFRTTSKIETFELKSELRDKLDNIYILSVEDVPIFFHSRMHSIGKRYIYQIWNDKKIEKDYHLYCWHLKERLDLKLMRKYSTLFLGKRDFKIFSRDDRSKNTIKTIFKIKIHNIKQLVLIEITGDSFLYNMARCMVASLVALTYGRLKPEDITLEKKEILIAPPEGLFLDQVFY